MILEPESMRPTESDLRIRHAYEVLSRTPVRDLIAKGITLAELKGLLAGQNADYAVQQVERVERLVGLDRPVCSCKCHESPR